MKPLFWSLICHILLLSGCVNGNRKKEEAKAIEVKEKASGSPDVNSPLLDSLKMLYDDELVLLDSLIGVKNTSADENDELGKKIEEQKKEIERLLIKVEEHTIVH